MDLKQVKKFVNPEKTLVFNFFKSDRGVTLTVKNPFKKMIKYHINMFNAAGDSRQTSSCPVIAGGFVHEMWPHPIAKLTFTNIHFLGKSEAKACIY